MRVTRSTRPSTRKGMQRFLWSCMRRGESCGKAIHCDIIFSFMPTSIKKTMPILQYQGVNTLVSNFGRWQCGWTSRCFCGCFTTITMQLLTNFTAGLLCFSCTKLRAWATTPFAHTLLVSALPGLQSSPGWSQFTNWQCPLFFFLLFSLCFSSYHQRFHQGGLLFSCQVNTICADSCRICSRFYK